MEIINAVAQQATITRKGTVKAITIPAMAPPLRLLWLPPFLSEGETA
jgi:hypothetical protein